MTLLCNPPKITSLCNNSSNPPLSLSRTIKAVTAHGLSGDTLLIRYKFPACSPRDTQFSLELGGKDDRGWFTTVDVVAIDEGESTAALDCLAAAFGECKLDLVKLDYRVSIPGPVDVEDRRAATLLSYFGVRKGPDQPVPKGAFSPSIKNLHCLWLPDTAISWFELDEVAERCPALRQLAFVPSGRADSIPVEEREEEVMRLFPLIECIGEGVLMDSVDGSIGGGIRGWDGESDVGSA